MSERVLITGGAGFIGSHVADELLSAGYRVRVLDHLSPQVHGTEARRPEYLADEVELIVGDIRDGEVVRRALAGVDAVFHLAAAVGVGQSMYQIAEYTSLNNMGTAVLLEALIERREQIRRLVVASSMSIYGEGLYHDVDGQSVTAAERSQAQLRDHDWELRDSQGRPLTPMPTPETKTPALSSIYALSKFDQERMCLLIGNAYGIEAVALRFFNVFGPRQALSNPYTGVLAIFASRLLNDRPPVIFEDGQQRRDFVSVYDIAQAARLALTVPEAAGEVFNIGSGQASTVCEIARKMANALGKTHLEPEIAGKYRVGDIRHCFADITRAQKVLGYQPAVTLEQGIVELSGWLEGQVAYDRVDAARAELDRRGLAI
ncbi:MAG TPA: NAD-dependent epimerase/dehydratase family protein [Tepidisphaeraceae bacterium]|jgi:dTDP-L-rhamnose 4-epimerase